MDTPGSLKAVTMEELRKLSPSGDIDLLKLDIEGSEKEVFSENYNEWLDKTNAIIIELHDWFKHGCGNAFYTATSNSKYREFKKGESTVLIRCISSDQI